MPTPHIHRQCIRNLLTDCQVPGPSETPGRRVAGVRATSYPTGEPVVPTALFERVQSRIRSNKRGAPSHSKANPLAGVLRCGLCGQSLRSHRSSQKLKSGKVLQWHTWITYPLYCRELVYSRPACDLCGRCSTTTSTRMRAPLLLAELRDRMCGDSITALMDEKATLCRDLEAGGISPP